MSTTTNLTPGEHGALDAFLRGASTIPPGARDGAAWVRFGLGCLLEAGKLLRERSLAAGEGFELKPDGSPVTRLEAEVEDLVRERLARFEPEAAFIGEESGGALPDAGLAVAVDPIDGTWAFLAETATWASVLTVFEDGRPLAGFVANPVTGEIAHALHDAWRRGELGVVRATGGSPAWGLVEAARGHDVYLNAWDRSPTEPFDLAAGALIVRRAGGDVTDADGAPIDATRHVGPWMAAIDAARRARVTELVRGKWPQGAGG
jgi:fructose-1,6-bisphosphatase/inositol monophosphatase family enzyme